MRVDRVAFTITNPCKQAERESSIAVEAVDQTGKPATGIEVAAVNKERKREQVLRLGDTGRGKLWIRRNQKYFITVDGFGGAESVLPLEVSLGCEVGLRIEVERKEVSVIR